MRGRKGIRCSVRGGEREKEIGKRQRGRGGERNGEGYMYM